MAQSMVMRERSLNRLLLGSYDTHDCWAFWVRNPVPEESLSYRFGN